MAYFLYKISADGQSSLVATCDDYLAGRTALRAHRQIHRSPTRQSMHGASYRLVAARRQDEAEQCLQADYSGTGASTDPAHHPVPRQPSRRRHGVLPEADPAPGTHPDQTPATSDWLEQTQIDSDPAEPAADPAPDAQPDQTPATSDWLEQAQLDGGAVENDDTEQELDLAPYAEYSDHRDPWTTRKR